MYIPLVPRNYLPFYTYLPVYFGSIALSLLLAYGFVLLVMKYLAKTIITVGVFALLLIATIAIFMLRLQIHYIRSFTNNSSACVYLNCSNVKEVNNKRNRFIESLNKISAENLS